MRILLDAYFDNNFGDDLFIDLLLKRYPNALFYTFWKDTPQSVLDRASEFSNLVILPRGCEMQKSWNYDAYIMIGGDVLPSGIDYSERISCMRNVKACGGYVAMLGFSLYEEYEEKTIRDLREMAGIADVIVIRDKISANRFKELVPGADVTEATDMVFTADFGLEKCGKDNVLGIIPRRKLYSTEEEHLAYCRSMAQIADAYLDKHDDFRVRFLAYSTGEYDDRAVAQDIIGMLKEPDKAEVIGYEGDIAAFLEKIATCKVLLPTRFHGLVLALIFRIPFVPVPYEVKVKQLLEELNYKGVQVPYGTAITSELVEAAASDLDDFGIAESNLCAYEQKKELFFAEVDAWSKNQPHTRKRNCSVVCQANDEVVRLRTENDLLNRQVAELENWIRSLQQERVAFEQQNAELEKIRQEQLSNMESMHRTCKAFERQNLELEAIRKWQAEKLKNLTFREAKLDTEYACFVKKLNEEIAKQFDW